MEATVLKIAMAGLLHDIGKFAQGCLEVTPGYLNNNADYQPFNKKLGRHTHIHAVYTAAFIEQFADLLPPEWNMGGWGDGDSFVNLAAGHHNPRSPMQWIIAAADRISSGFDRDSFDKGEAIKIADFRKTRLLPLLEGLTTEKEKQKSYDDSNNFHYRYALGKISPETIFPILKDKLTREGAAEEYRELFNNFHADLPLLLHRIEAPELWCRHFDSLLLLYTSLIPAARVGDVIHDVSLYDHCRTTAALAVALYLYHFHHNTLDEASIIDNNIDKFLLVNGDFYGIQDFIFAQGGESGKYRSKLLRGRSFQVSLFTELAAERLCSAIGLPETAIILNAAGKFTLLVPNTEKAKKAISEVEQEINDWLFKTSCGQCGIGISSIKASPSDFINGEFSSLWDRLSDAMAEKKLHKLDLDRYGGTIPDYFKEFSDGLGICPLCGRRPAEKTTADDFYLEGGNPVCTICRDQILLGANLVKNDCLAVCNTISPEVSRDKALLTPIFGCYHVIFPDGPMLEEAARGELVDYWNLGSAVYKTERLESTVRLLGSYVPMLADGGDQNRQVMDFGRIAVLSLGEKSDELSGENPSKPIGTEALGVFKADIDDLGLLLGCGISQERLTLSRLATLSRQLNNFFTIYLPSFLSREKSYQGVYTVFAGGDDLFLIGPWNRVIDLAGVLQKRFAEYVCHNDDLHFSAGISLHKPHTPIDRLAREAEAGLENAKHLDQAKNRLSLFGETITWKTYANLDEIRKQLLDWLKRGVINKTMLYRFAALCDEASRAKRAEECLKKGGKVDFAVLSSLKWRSRLCYLMERNAGRGLSGNERKKALEKLNIVAQWLNEYDSAMKIPLWRILYDWR